MENQKQTVVVVEDDTDLAESLVEVLEGAGFKAKGYTQALKAVDDDVALMLIDMGMNEGVILAAQTNYPKLLCLLMSGQSAERTAYAAGALGIPYLCKPFSIEDLLAVIGRLITPLKTKMV